MAGRRDVEAGRAFVRLYMKDELGTSLRKSLGQATEAVKQFGKVAAVAVGAATAAITASVAEFVNAGAELKKLSLQTGATVEDLSSLQFAAKKTRTEFDDVVGAMEELNIRLGEAVREGTGPLNETFERLGISVEEFRKLDFVTQIKMIRDQFSGMDRDLRGFNLDEIFGGDAFKIIPLIESDLEGLTDQAERFGLVMSTDAVNAASEVASAFADIKLALLGASRQFAEGFIGSGDAADTMKNLADVLAEIDWTGWGERALDSLKSVAQGVALVGKAVALLQRQLNVGKETTIGVLEVLVSEFTAGFGPGSEGKQNRQILLDSLKNSREQVLKDNLAAERRLAETVNSFNDLIAPLTGEPGFKPFNIETFGPSTNPAGLGVDPFAGGPAKSRRKNPFATGLPLSPIGGKRESGLPNIGRMFEDEEASPVRRGVTPSLVTTSAYAAQGAGFGGGTELQKQTKTLNDSLQVQRRVERILSEYAEIMKHA